MDLVANKQIESEVRTKGPLFPKRRKKREEQVDKWLGLKITISYSEICPWAPTWSFLDQSWKPFWYSVWLTLKNTQSNACLHNIYLWRRVHFCCDMWVTLYEAGVHTLEELGHVFAARILAEPCCLLCFPHHSKAAIFCRVIIISPYVLSSFQIVR